MAAGQRMLSFPYPNTIVICNIYVVVLYRGRGECHFLSRQTHSESESAGTLRKVPAQWVLSTKSEYKYEPLDEQIATPLFYTMLLPGYNHGTRTGTPIGVHSTQRTAATPKYNNAHSRQRSKFSNVLLLLLLLLF